ncbi:TetR/AcrR family transcriptional regulator [Sedimentitalea todarodis]|uniref:Helix-turn-helix domain-containing protein n=1 Tax=Sedimentitalea todarodis TaxID=1631240 RepID=A0ABU3V8Y6_9RHOB|nr:helix-turn-helix domain-containing protein [Sedimentitalea todarodis]MDU9002614.1 helix-turn-helix domain-containing protein [Sedimentitalea todarodis]
MMRDATDSRQDAILQSALRVFATYGFRKTSMNDIANGAGMSRPAVYQHYKNKDEIFRRLTQIYYDQAADALATVFSAHRPVTETLHHAFDAQVGDMVEALLASPHGMELLDTGERTAADIKQTGEDRLRVLYADWLKQQAEHGRIDLPDTPEQVADVILVALKGLKTTVSSVPQLRARLAAFASLIGRGLEAA